MKKIKKYISLAILVLSGPPMFAAGIIETETKKVTDVRDSIEATVKAVDDFTVKITRLVSALEHELSEANKKGIAFAVTKTNELVTAVGERDVQADNACKFLDIITGNMNAKGKGLADSLTAHVAE